MTIGGTAATSVTVVNSTSITATTPAGTAGSASVVVTTPGGSNAANTLYTYVNDAPTITDIADQTISEDGATSALTFTIGDAETAAASLTVSGSSSDTTLVPNANIVFGGSGANRTVTVTPAANQNGSATITVTVSDGTANTSDTFVLTVNAVNDAPTITDIADQTINEDGATSALAFTVGDAETAAASLTVSGSSSDTTLVPNANIVVGGSGASRTVTVTPAANQNGSATITVTASDGTANTSDTFVLTVNAVNDAPTITDVADQTISEDGATSALAFTIGDAETAAGSLTVSGSSSDTTLVPDANLVFGGSGASRTVTVTPAANQNGSATITVTVSDGTDSANDTFVLVVTSVADTPSVTDATTLVNTQTTSGLVVTRHTADGAEVTHVKITNLTNGALFQADGTTAIANNAFITTAQATSGLRFTPGLNLSSPANAFGFDVQAAVGAVDAALGGAVVHATVTVNQRASGAVVGSSANPNTMGNAVTLTATVSDTSGPIAAAGMPASQGQGHASGPTATGTVQFKDGEANFGPVQALVNGQASFTTATLLPGSHSVTAVFSGDAVYLPVTSAPLVQSVVCQTITVNPPTLPSGKRLVAYGPVTLTQTGALGGATFTLTGTLPAGLTVVNGVLSGTPTVAGTFEFTVTASDGNGCAGSRAYTLVIELGPPAIDVDPEGTPPPGGCPTPGVPCVAATSSFFHFSGTASDDSGIVKITWHNAGYSGDATWISTDADNPGATMPKTARWDADVPLVPGNNDVTFTAIDSDGLTTPFTVTAVVNALTYYLAEGVTGPFFDTYLLISNPTTTPAPVVITFFKTDGTTATMNATLAPTTRRTIPVDGVAGMENTPFSTQVVSTDAVPLAVERSTYWDGRYLAGHAAPANDQLRTRWTFAEGTTQLLETPGGSVPLFETYVLLGNPSPTAANVTVRYLVEGGPAITQNTVVPASSRATLAAAAVPGLANKAFGIEVLSDLPIVAARSVYFGAGWRGGESSEGSTPSTTWLYAEGPTGPFFDTFLLMANPGATPATVTVTYYPETGGPVTRVKTIAPNSRITVHVDEEDPAVANTTVWMRVTSDVPIAAERAVFWPGVAGTWVETHGGTGAQEAATHWALAEGAVGGPLDFQTFVLLANPSATDAQVQVTYLRENGIAVIKTYAVGALQRRVVHINGLVPELQDEGVAIDIRSTNNVPIVVERSIYWSGFGGGTSVTAVRVP